MLAAAAQRFNPTRSGLAALANERFLRGKVRISHREAFPDTKATFE